MAKCYKELSFKQALFLRLFLQVGNASQALKEAGYKTKHPNRVAYKLLEHPIIKDRIDKHRQASKDNTQVTFDWKINKLKEIVLGATKEQDKISAIEVMNKMQGDNAPEKHHNTNLNFDVTLEDSRAISEQYFNDYQAKLNKD